MTKTKKVSPDSPPAKRVRRESMYIPASIQEEPQVTIEPAVPKHKPKVPSPLAVNGLEALRAAFWLQEKAESIETLKAAMGRDDHGAFKKALRNAAPYLGGINDPEIRAYVDQYCLRLMKGFIKDSRSQEETRERIHSFVENLE